MFSALLLIFMVGFSIKDIFYDYLRSGYGNIPDMKVKLNNLSEKELLKIKSDIVILDKNIDLLYGYEDVYNITVTDSEDSVLTNDMPTLIKGINFQNKIEVLVDGKRELFEIKSFEYDDGLEIDIKLNGFKLKDKDSIKFLVKGSEISSNFCTLTSVEEGVLSLKSTFCRDKIDDLFQRLEEKNSTYIAMKIEENSEKLRINEIDRVDRTIVLAYEKEILNKAINLKIEDIEILNKQIESFESYDGELIITFKRDGNLELEYKRFIAEILKNYVNYNRFVLKVQNYTFSDDEKSEEDSSKDELTRLNELTDFLDIIVKPDNSVAISSSYLAYDLNNLGVLSNFTIDIDEISFMSSIRSTFSYNPELLYDKNILIFNKKVLENKFSIADINNFIDVYVQHNEYEKMELIKEIVQNYDKNANFIMKEDIIPSIKPKKRLFNIIVLSFTILIFGILFIAMYVVLRQFYSNFESELALLKLFGLNQPYQTYINLMSFSAASVMIFYLLKIEESNINMIMIKYFFTKYNFDMFNYVISLSILSFYIFVIYLLEIVSIKKLNLIKGQ